MPPPKPEHLPFIKIEAAGILQLQFTHSRWAYFKILGLFILLWLKKTNCLKNKIIIVMVASI